MSAFLLSSGAATGSPYVTIALIVGMIALFYFFLIRPQKKQQREADEMRNSLQVGDEITTIGGIIGKVISIKEETFVLETTKEKTHIRFLKSSVRSVDVKAEDATRPLKTAPAAKENEKKKAPEGKPAEKPAEEKATEKPAEEKAAEKPAEEKAPEIKEPETDAAPEMPVAEVSDEKAD